MKQLMLGVAAIALLTACGPAKETAKVEAPAPAPVANADGKYVTAEGLELSSPDTWGKWGINLDTQNPDIRPGDDFYAFVNGKWLDSFVIPADRTRYSSFTLLAEKSEQRVHKIIEELAAAKPDPATLEGKVATIYNAYMDTATIEAKGLAPAQPYIDRIKAMSSREDLARIFAANGFASPIGGWVDVDSKSTEDYIFYINQGGLGMGDRDYYLVANDKNKELLAGYKTMLTGLLTEAGYADAAAAADQVIALETRIAEAHWDRAAGRNRDLTYNKMSRDDLIALAGAFPAATMINDLALGDQSEFVVRQVTPTAEEIAENGLTPEDVAKISGGGIEGIFKVMQDAPLDQWKAYLTAHLLIDASDVLPARIDDTVFNFYGKQLSGLEEQRVRWKRGVETVEDSVGEAVGKVYAERYFPAENKAAMDKLVANLRVALAEKLQELDWMGAETKAEAEAKLDQFTPKIGYTEKFETYDSLVVTDDAFANQMAVNDWAYKDMISDLGKPIDRTEWGMLPQTVNAYYSPNRNEIVFPAAILQPPFFNLSADPAVNYGAIGGVIGHEIGHGFDDQGAKSDGTGMLRNWWTAEDEANFKAKTSALVAQYNAFCPYDDGETCVNGALTLGENIGDLGGLSMAYKAYHLSLNGKKDKVIDGLTGDQRFFMAWAQVWRSKNREEAMRRQMLTDPHSPPNYRVNGIVRNFDEWYTAFDVGPDDALYLPPEQRIRIW
ncbi:M13 family metallopeptidase [Hyphomonas johnsonii]|uniref:M13 family peptidase n=1 Tax=Hyphomonas johnsonii MHS-2 TaxID=1280950 RepID=A0A059FPX6_9PROT|nr:M13 family metallopeptidase [Hyphomonas johnsonii]KCZ92714.1 M13 family peptidase [Hyphomonas johnsonii MHS-2]